MKQKISSHISHVRTNILRVTRLHFVYVLALAGQLMLFDATKLLTPEVVMQRWIATALLLLVTTFAWYMARTRLDTIKSYRMLLLSIILLDIAMASFAVYTQRGMASRSVFLYVVPLLSATALMTRAAIFGTLALSIAAYTTTTVVYFVTHFNEGYKAELYGEVGFYSVMLAIVAMFAWNMVRSKRKT
jgi:hypothetical protein